jgi:predicted nucleic acid-binding protein
VATTIDASVIGEIMFRGIMEPNARCVLGGSGPFIAPSVIEAELLSAATKRVRVLGMNERKAYVRWREGRSLPIERFRVAPYLDDAFDLSIALNHPSANCLYLAVAIREDAPLVTGDRGLYDSVTAAGLGAHIRWLGDY